ncbi:hypothetical protein QZH41_008731, partial [Actinostola sp. cb2023]
LAYAMLASLPAITGLYLAFVPLLVYVLLGTSRHLSLGTFAVVCLMIGSVVEREVPDINEPSTSAPYPLSTLMSPNFTTSTPDFTNLVVKVISNASNPNPEDMLAAKRIEVAVTLALLVGIIQFTMGLFRLGFVAVYLSDPLISGFTTGAAVLVFTSQIQHILGIKVPRYSGVFAAIKAYIYMFSHITDAIPGSIVTGVICIALLIILKKIDEKTRPIIKFPIPADLIAVILGTGITYGVETHKKYDVSVLGYIPKGIPPLTVPNVHLMGNIITDAVVIAVVIFATNISLVKMFAKKKNDNIDANQELIAYGSVNIIGSFFSCFPVSGSLSRSAVQETLVKTLMCNFPIVIVILVVLLFAAPLFYCLPKAVLAAIVIVALKGLFKQFARLYELWKICKYDAAVWFSTWLAVVVLGIDTGLAVGIIVALLFVLIHSSRPGCVILGHVPYTGIYRDITRFPGAREFPGIKIFRFEAALVYANVEFFRNELIRKINLNPDDVNKNVAKQPLIRYSSGAAGKEKTGDELEAILRDQSLAEESVDVMNGKVEKPKTSSESSGSSSDEYCDNGIAIHTIIIDCSTFNFIDTQGVTMLIQVCLKYAAYTLTLWKIMSQQEAEDPGTGTGSPDQLLSLEFKKIGVNFDLAGCRHGIREMLDKAGFTDEIGIHHVFISVQDAVIHARYPNDEIEEVMSFDTEMSTPNVSAWSSIIIPTLTPCPEESSSSQVINCGGIL